MKNETEKLNKFKLAVFSQAQRQAQSITGGTSSQQKQRLRDAKKQTQSELKTELDKIKKDFEAQTLRSISSSKLTAQRNVLSHRSKMIERVFENIRSSLLEHCKGEEYPAELKARLEKCISACPDKKGTAFFTSRDIELGKELCKGTKLTAKETAAFTLGGVMVVFDETGVAYDCTYDAAFERERQGFSAKAGLADI